MFKKLFSEFKDFASKGDVISLAIGVVIGSSFKGVIDSLVSDIIMPPISFLTSRVDFSNQFISLNGVKYETLAQAQEAGASVIGYGNFINQLIIFLITAFAIFLFVYKVQTMIKGKKKDGSLKENTKHCKYCDMSISINATKCPYCTSKV
jgi:large conductance mechanosensitive channel